MDAQIDLPLAIEAAASEPESRPWPENKLTPALLRVLEKAQAKGCVRRAGIYADAPQAAVADHPEFDWQTAIDRCIACGWLTGGTAFNTYVLTAAGTAQLAPVAARGAA